MERITQQTLRLGTRKSELALWQANKVKEEIQSKFPKQFIELVLITTMGDKNLKDSLHKLDDKGVFVKEIEEALLQNHIDFAVHSMKDLPSKIPEGLKVSSMLQRASVCDVLISSKYSHIDQIPLNGKIGTSSLRRISQLLSFRPDLRFSPLRGNVPTRIHKCDELQLDGIILAEAGVTRLGLQEHISYVFPVLTLLPAVGQGAIGIESRTTDTHLFPLFDSINDSVTYKAVSAERIILSQLEAGCEIPLAAYANIRDNTITITAKIFSFDGKQQISHVETAPISHAEEAAYKTADIFIRRGAKDFIQQLKKELDKIPLS